MRKETGVRLQVLSGAEEARATFLAVRRWFGWSAGRLLVLDIGGGSLEIAAGIDETPDLAMSLPLGAGRLTRERLGVDRDTSSPPSPKAVDELQAYVEKQLDPAVAKLADVRLGPRGGHVEDVPDPGPPGRRRTLPAGALGAARPDRAAGCARCSASSG